MTTQQEKEYRLLRLFGHEKYICLIKMYNKYPPENCCYTYSEETLAHFVNVCKRKGWCDDVVPTFENVYALVRKLPLLKD